MTDEFKKFELCCSYEPPTKYHDGYTPLELKNTLINMINECIEYVNSLESRFDEKEDVSYLTNTRKLSLDGDFNGTLANKMKTALQVVQQIDNNRDQIQYLNNQFSDGQTGLVVDGGFFEETGIARNYDGGVF